MEKLGSEGVLVPGLYHQKKPQKNNKTTLNQKERGQWQLHSSGSKRSLVWYVILRDISL